MAIRNKNTHLLFRSGYWHFNKRLPTEDRHVRISLKTKEIIIAHQKRDGILAEWDKFATKITSHQDLIAIRKQYLSTFKDDERELLEDQIIDDSEELAHQLGVWDLIKSATPEDQLSEKEKKPLLHWQTATGKLISHKAH